MYRKKWHLIAMTACFMLLSVVALPSRSAAQMSDDGPRDVRELDDPILARNFQGLIDVINSGDRERVERFTAERYGRQMLRDMDAQQQASFLWGIWVNHGGLELVGFRTDPARIPPHFAVGIVRSPKKDIWLTVQVGFDPGQDYRIVSLMVVPSRPPMDLVDMERLDDTGIARELLKYTAAKAGEDEFSGAVLLAQNDKVLFNKAFGLASREFEIPNRLDTRFSLGSMNKMFTAVAIGQLVEQQKLAFDDPIEKHLPAGWIAPEIASRVTIAHLLSHTSGLGDYLEGFLESPGYKFITLEDYKDLVSQETLQFEPGSRWAYSNTGFLLLGVIVAEVSGEDYFDYIRDHIYTVARMSSTDSFDIRRPVPNLAVGYSSDQDGWLNNTMMLSPRGTSAGGGYSTVEDLLRFDQALRAGKLIQPATFDLLGTPKPDLNSRSYGYGFMIMGPPTDRIVGHGGIYPGVSAHLSMYLDSGYTFAVLSNGSGAQMVTAKIIELISRREE
jgi:CubicO group peptidase (beta-lactamase class C family)